MKRNEKIGARERKRDSERWIEPRSLFGIQLTWATFRYTMHFNYTWKSQTRWKMTQLPTATTTTTSKLHRKEYGFAYHEYWY